jgi:hypothetical protein
LTVAGVVVLPATASFVDNGEVVAAVVVDRCGGMFPMLAFVDRGDDDDQPKTMGEEEEEEEEEGEGLLFSVELWYPPTPLVPEDGCGGGSFSMMLFIYNISLSLSLGCCCAVIYS